MNRFLIVMFLLLLGLLMVFVLQNSEIVAVQFLFWSFSARLLTLMSLIALIGFLGGGALTAALFLKR